MVVALSGVGWVVVVDRVVVVTGMTSFPVGLALRLVGPLIELVCLILLQRWGGQERTVAGIPVEYPLYAGLAFGFVLVVLGLTWFRARPALRMRNQP